ncbi:hypothetical protein [Metabacillus fastidiosus]|uniref:hypothetical protein n=1 Tax=Metabacillus fastidiosus TaxID=1458 RepID=UPI003D2BE02A
MKIINKIWHSDISLFIVALIYFALTRNLLVDSEKFSILITFADITIIAAILMTIVNKIVIKKERKKTLNAFKKIRKTTKNIWRADIPLFVIAIIHFSILRQTYAGPLSNFVIYVDIIMIAAILMTIVNRLLIKEDIN